MNRSLKLVLTGIFLAVASVWFLIAGGGDLVFAVIGSYILPLCALVYFLMGIAGEHPEETTEDPSVPTDEENKE